MLDERKDDSMRDAFARDGYVILRGLCPSAVVERLAACAHTDLAERRGPLELESQVGYPGAPSPGARGGETVRRLLDALGRDPALVGWAADPDVIGAVRRLLGVEDVRVVRAHHNCIMTKHPDHSSSTGWHQDLRYWAFERPELVNAWTALGTESENNGGMRVIPGSHKEAFAADCFDDQRFFREDRAGNRRWLDRSVQVDLAPGDVLFFHAGLLHAAGRNTTDERKLSVVFSYRAAANRPIPGTRSAAADDLDPDRVGPEPPCG